MLSLQRFKSKSASYGSVNLDLKFSFGLFLEKVTVEVLIKLASSLIFNDSFSGSVLHDICNFFFLSFITYKSKAENYALGL